MSWWVDRSRRSGRYSEGQRSRTKPLTLKSKSSKQAIEQFGQTYDEQLKPILTRITGSRNRRTGLAGLTGLIKPTEGQADFYRRLLRLAAISAAQVRTGQKSAACRQ